VAPSYAGVVLGSNCIDLSPQMGRPEGRKTKSPVPESKSQSWGLWGGHTGQGRLARPCRGVCVPKYLHCIPGDAGGPPTKSSALIGGSTACPDLHQDLCHPRLGSSPSPFPTSTCHPALANTIRGGLANVPRKRWPC
jgi:hypothetical protein